MNFLLAVGVDVYWNPVPVQNVAWWDIWTPGLLTCLPNTAVAVLSGVACDFAGDAQVPEADLAFIALQSLACHQSEGERLEESERERIWLNVAVISLQELASRALMWTAIECVDVER